LSFSVAESSGSGAGAPGAPLQESGIVLLPEQDQMAMDTIENSKVSAGICTAVITCNSGSITI